MEKFTADPLKQTDQILQPDTGYRFSIDPFLLVGQICLIGTEKVLDIGCGCGIIPLLLVEKYPGITVQAVELQKELAQYALANIKNRQFEKSIHIFNQDIAQLECQSNLEKADVIISNPPYTPKGSGRINPDRQKALARHEIALNMSQLVDAADRLLEPSGQVYLIYPLNRLNDILTILEEKHFFVYQLCFVHTRPGKKAAWFIIQTGKIKKSCKISAPFYIYNQQDCFTDDYLSLFNTGLSMV